MQSIFYFCYHNVQFELQTNLTHRYAAMSINAATKFEYIPNSFVLLVATLHKRLSALVT